MASKPETFFYHFYFHSRNCDENLLKLIRQNEKLISTSTYLPLFKLNIEMNFLCRWFKTKSTESSLAHCKYQKTRTRNLFENLFVKFWKTLSNQFYSTSRDAAKSLKLDTFSGNCLPISLYVKTVFAWCIIWVKGWTTQRRWDRQTQVVKITNDISLFSLLTNVTRWPSNLLDSHNLFRIVRVYKCIYSRAYNIVGRQIL